MSLGSNDFQFRCLFSEAPSHAVRNHIARVAAVKGVEACQNFRCFAAGLATTLGASVIPLPRLRDTEFSLSRASFAFRGLFGSILTAFFTLSSSPTLRQAQTDHGSDLELS